MISALHMPRRRPFSYKVWVSAAAMFMAATTPADAQPTFPDHPLRMISGFAPGGSSDTLTRLVAEAVTPILGQRVIVENRTGVNGVIAAALVAQSPPDGYMVYQCSMSTLAITPQLQGATLPIDPGQETVPVANVALSSYGLVVAANSPAKSVNDIVVAARQRPDHITFGSPGSGSAQHLSGVLMGRIAKVDMVHVSYRGAAPALLDVLAGRIDFMITNLGDVARQVQGGELRLLGQGDPSIFPGLTTVPRIADAVPGFEVTGWFGICGHKDMPGNLRQRWSDAIGEAMQQTVLRQRLQNLGFTPHFEDSSAFARRLATDRGLWRKVIEAGSVKAD